MISFRYLSSALAKSGMPASAAHRPPDGLGFPGDDLWDAVSITTVNALAFAADA
jgi:hypothetical protein